MAVVDLSHLHNEQSYCRSIAARLPDGFPVALTTNMAWVGSGLADEKKYVYELTEDYISEIEAGLAAFKGM